MIDLLDSHEISTNAGSDENMSLNNSNNYNEFEDESSAK